jgi:hypothetical protein
MKRLFASALNEYAGSASQWVNCKEAEEAKPPGSGALSMKRGPENALGLGSFEESCLWAHKLWIRHSLSRGRLHRVSDNI